MRGCHVYEMIEIWYNYFSKYSLYSCVGKTNFILFWGVCNLVNTQCGQIFEFTFEFNHSSTILYFPCFQSRAEWKIWYILNIQKNWNTISKTKWPNCDNCSYNSFMRYPPTIIALNLEPPIKGICKFLGWLLQKY